MLSRAEMLLDAGIARAEIATFLTDLAGTVHPVDLHPMWRAQLRDPNDERVLGTAVNGRADASVPPNLRDFGDAPGRLGIGLWTRRRLGKR